MNIGCQIHAPRGLGGLSAGVRYYYAGRSAKWGALLVWFYLGIGKKWRVAHLHLSAEVLEAELADSRQGLKVMTTQSSLPVWLSDLEGVNFDSLGQSRVPRKKSFRQEAEDRLFGIGPLLEREQEILSAENPVALAAQIGRNYSPKVHAHRLQLWFFVYVLHAHNIWALKGATHKNGTWSRAEEEHRLKKFGRPSLDKGSQHGWSSLHFRDVVIRAYCRLVGLGETMRKIHRRALVDDFGCRVFKESDGQERIYHPQNRPYPTYGQFRDIVVKSVGLEQVQTAVYGQARMRRVAMVDLGNYTQQYANVLENIEVDAYRCHARPVATFSDEPMPALIVARAICATTGAVVGVGFSLGGETKEAYRAMFFSMAITSADRARLHGIPESMLRWTMQGVCRSLLSDRGPGGQESLIENLQDRFPVKAITPSYTGQAKPQVEAGNPKSVDPEGEPTYILSDLDVAGMMRQELMRAARDNRTRNISARLSDEVIHDFQRLGYVATPENYWTYLTDRLRTNAQQMDFARAVRAFCRPVVMQVDKTGVRLGSAYYTSVEFRESGAHRAAVRGQMVNLRGYVLLMATRYVWIETAGKLYEVERMRRTRVDQEEFFVPLSSLEETAKVKAELDSRTRNAAEAAHVQTAIDFKKLTGKSWESGTRKKGTPKKGRGTTTHEAKVISGERLGRAA